MGEERLSFVALLSIEKEMKGLFASSTTLGICGIWAYCRENGGRRIVYDMTDDHIASLENRSDLQLKFVQVFFRHGARTPLSVLKNLEEVQWKNDELFHGAEHTSIPYQVHSLTGGPQPKSPVEHLYRKTTLPGGAFKGQLTTIGMEHCYKLGQRLRIHYQDKLHFLPKTFRTQDFYFRSTNIVRTIESLRSVVAGLCHPLKDPVKIYVETAAHEILYPNAQFCPLLRKFYKAVYADIDHVPGMQPHRVQLQKQLGLSDKERIDFVNARDTVMAREAHGLFVPQFLRSQLDHINQRAVEVMTYVIGGRTEKKVDKDVLQFTAGNLMRFITTNLDAAANSQCKNKMQLYSCHDTSLFPALLALDIFSDLDTWPDWSADLIFELYQDRKGRSYVRTLYLGEEVNIRGTKEGLVPLEKFKEEIKPFSMEWEEFQHLCQLPQQ